MRKVADERGETIHLGVIQGISSAFIEKIDFSYTLGVETKIGTTVRLDKGASPQALMAFCPQRTFEKLCNTIRNEEKGNKKVVRLKALRDENKKRICNKWRINLSQGLGNGRSCL